MQAPPSTTVAAQAAAAPVGTRGRRQIAKVFSLSREAELSYIRSDLRRLLYTAAVLFVLMIVLLIIIE